MANNINYVKLYGKELDQKLTQQAMTAEIETPNVDWEGGQSFYVPTISMGGYGDHSRNGGWNRQDVELKRELYTLEQDRDVEFFIDRMDVEESGDTATMAEISTKFIQERATPEIDAYRFGKLCDYAIAEGRSITEEINEGNVFRELKRRLLDMRKYGTSNLLIYVSSETMDALERSTEFRRDISVMDQSNGRIESRVTHIDGVRIVEVWDKERFNTKHTFLPGGGGFEPNGEDINFLVVAKPAIIAKAKHQAIFLFGTGQHTLGDGFLYQNRIYHDLFKMKHKQDALFVSVKEPIVMEMSATVVETTKKAEEPEREEAKEEKEEQPKQDKSKNKTKTEKEDK